MTSDATVAAGFALGLIDLAVSKGAARQELTARARIDPAELHDPDGRIPLAKYMALMRAGKELTNDPALALRFGETVQISEVSVLGLVGSPSGTVADGLRQVNRYARLAVDVAGPAGDRFQLERIRGRLWLVDARTHPDDFPELTESTWARIVCSVRRRLGDRTIVREVHVTHAEPSYRAEYDRIFRVPVVFKSDKNALLLSDAALTHSVAFSPRYASRVFNAHAETLLEKLESSKSIRGRVESCLSKSLHTGSANIDAVARELGATRQTLFRKLKAEGVTFAEVLHALREKMALHYLREKKLSVNETAYLLGFSDPAAFSRAFKRWTGSSPRTLRGRSKQ